MVWPLHAAGALGDAVVERAKLPSTGLTGVHVLVADDDADARALVATVLEYAGALVTLSASGREALDVLDHVRPDVVVSDVAMPGGDGYWLVRELRTRAGGHGGEIPAVAITAYGETHGPDRTLAAGFAAHLRKPLDPWELCRIVAELGRRR